MSQSLYQLIFHWPSLAKGKFQRKFWINLSYGIAWGIWLARNDLVFNGRARIWDKIFYLILHRLVLWLRSKNKEFHYTGLHFVHNAEGIFLWTNCFWVINFLVHDWLYYLSMVFFQVVCLLKVKRIIGLVYLLIWTLFSWGYWCINWLKQHHLILWIWCWSESTSKKNGLLLLHSITSDILKPSEYPPVILLKYNCQ